MDKTLEQRIRERAHEIGLRAAATTVRPISTWLTAEREVLGDADGGGAGPAAGRKARPRAQSAQPRHHPTAKSQARALAH